MFLKLQIKNSPDICVENAVGPAYFVDYTNYPGVPDPRIKVSCVTGTVKLPNLEH